jgi:hypothetical protein
MSLIASLWFIALVVMAGIYWHGVFWKKSAMRRMTGGPKDFTELMTREIQLLNHDFGRLLLNLRPHGARAVRAGLVVVKRGHDLVINRVYGRTSITRGSASSFFLKQIAEHKEGERDLPKGL